MTRKNRFYRSGDCTSTSLPATFLLRVTAFGAVFLFAGNAGTAALSGQGQSATVTTPRILPRSALPKRLFGFRNFAAEAKWDADFLAVPDARLAGEELKTLTAAPHPASTPEDYATAVYVARKFKDAGLQTEIVPYQVLMNFPKKILIEAFTSDGRVMSGPAPEHVDAKAFGGDSFQNDPRILPAFNGFSPSCDLTAEVVYANYGSPADFDLLAKMGVSVEGKIVLVRYGRNFRGVKVYVAQQRGAAGVLIYSDPADDGFFKGDKYPQGPWRPATAVQRGSVQYLFKYPGDPQTPGFASTPDVPDAARISQDKAIDLPTIPANPMSYADARPILRALQGPDSPREWQGALPFTYHLGPGGVKVHMLLEQDYALRTIWDVIGKIPGTAEPDEWVVAGNHRDAWVYGAVDPNSGTAAMLEAVHGLGDLLNKGWRPRRTILVGSWDAEEEGLIGSTEWAEQHAAELAKAAIYINTDVSVAGPMFEAAAVPSLKQFVRDVTREVPSPKGGTVYEQWQKAEEDSARGAAAHSARSSDRQEGQPDSQAGEVHVGDLGSGSDFTPFLQHLGVPSTDIGSNGPYGVYHSTFDDYDWFIRFADPTFAYEQQQARVFGLEILHMADADVLPYDYEAYGREILRYIEAAQTRVGQKISQTASDQVHAGFFDFAPAIAAAHRLIDAGGRIRLRQTSAAGDLHQLNTELRAAEEALLDPSGLPGRPWYKHTIYAPGEYTGYAAVVIPGVNEALDSGDENRAKAQLASLAAALNASSAVLESVAR